VLWFAAAVRDEGWRQEAVGRFAKTAFICRHWLFMPISLEGMIDRSSAGTLLCQGVVLVRALPASLSSVSSGLLPKTKSLAYVCGLSLIDKDKKVLCLGRVT